MQSNQQPTLRKKLGLTLGIATLLLLFPINLAASGRFPQFAYVILFFHFALMAVIGLGIPLWIRAKEIAAWKNKLQLDEDRAASQRLHAIFSEGQRLATELPQLLERATSYTGIARREFQAHAYSPFWDAVDEAALALSKFNTCANRMHKLSNEYRTAHRAGDQNLPGFAAHVQFSADPLRAVHELRNVVRSGQTHRDFALVWEHRKNREVMLNGFSSLTESLDGMEAGMVNTVTAIKDFEELFRETHKR